MPKYQYVGSQPRTYLGIVIPGIGSLAVEPGHVYDLDELPNDGNWVPYKTPVKDTPAVEKK